METIYDVAIIGGGINGCGCAADAALRGLSVVLCEQGDLAAKTSSSSTKLIHGGLRYLEQFDFSLVKKALDERQLLFKLAPHLVHPLPLMIPHTRSMRPMWIIYAGLFLYDHLSSKNKLPRSHKLSRADDAFYFNELKPEYHQGFLFYDGMTDDARLTIENALQAKAHGAHILTHTQVIHAEVHNEQWYLKLKTASNESQTIIAKSIINAAGPWSQELNQTLFKTPSHRQLSLIKGSHIVVQKLYEGEHAYLLQHEDHRVIFAIPYHGYTLIGTTEIPCESPPQSVEISSEEIDYLLELINHYFLKPLKRCDIVYSWSGIRPLLAQDEKSPSAISRDYVFDYTEQPAPAVTIYGGKITTYRQLAEKAIDKLACLYPALSASCTAITPLPGAKIPFDEFKSHAGEQYAWLPESILMRYLQTYGTRMQAILQNKFSLTDLGTSFGPELYQAEVDFLIREEWALTAEDILWRRTKLGLTMDEKNKMKLDNYTRSL